MKDSNFFPKEELCYVFDYSQGFYIASFRSLKVPNGMPPIPPEKNSGDDV